MADVKRGRVSAEEQVKIFADKEKGLSVEEICAKYQRSETVINKLLSSQPAAPEPVAPPVVAEAAPAKKKMGRPKGSKNAKKPKKAAPVESASVVAAEVTKVASGKNPALAHALETNKLELYILKLKGQLLEAGIVPL